MHKGLRKIQYQNIHQELPLASTYYIWKVFLILDYISQPNNEPIRIDYMFLSRKKHKCIELRSTEAINIEIDLS